eukprot:1562374-Pleurochrysis_carterae.AAC.2
MGSVVPELLHAGELNVDKQLHKQPLRWHFDDFTAEKVSSFYTPAWALRSTWCARTALYLISGSRRLSALA